MKKPLLIYHENQSVMLNRQSPSSSKYIKINLVDQATLSLDSRNKVKQ